MGLKPSGMLDDFAGWFTAAATGQYGGINCSDIMKFDEALKRERCPALIIATWAKIKETLADHGVDITVPPEEEKP